MKSQVSQDFGGCCQVTEGGVTEPGLQAAHPHPCREWADEQLRDRPGQASAWLPGATWSLPEAYPAAWAAEGQSCPVRSPSGSSTGDSRERATAERTGALPLPEALNHRSAVQRNDLLGLAGPVHEGRQILPGVPGQPPVFDHAGR